MADEEKAPTAEQASEDALKARDEQAKKDAKDVEKRDKEQADAAKAAAEAKGQPAPEDVRADADVKSGVDLANEAWTVQSDRPYYPSAEAPGQVFVKAQLPDRKVQRENGIDPDAHAAGLTVLDDKDAVKHVHAGPEPWEARDLGLV